MQRILAVLPISKAPLLGEYKQTSKTVDPLTQWYTTKNDAEEGALRVAVTIGGVRQHREAVFNILNELRMYNPTRVTISEVYVESKWSGYGYGLDSDVDFFLKDIYGNHLVDFKDVHSDFESYRENYAYPGIDVTGQTQFSIEVMQYVHAGTGGNDVRTRNMRVTFLFETATATYPITVRIIDEKGNLFPQAYGRIDTTSYDFPAGSATLELPAGDYTIEAWAYVEDKKYSGKKTFNVPRDPEVTVTLLYRPPLPWWWWIPVAFAGASAGFVALSIVKPKRAPPIIVVK